MGNVWMNGGLSGWREKTPAAPQPHGGFSQLNAGPLKTTEIHEFPLGILVFTEGNKENEGRGLFVAFVSFCANLVFIRPLRYFQ
jgi:hypothetical protein